VSYAAYAPVALAGIEGLNDVLADRSITVVMQRGLDRARLNVEVDAEDPVFAALRAMGYRVGLTRWPEVLQALDAVRARQDTFQKLAGRPLELYRPMIALALLASNDGDRSFLDDLSTVAAEDADSGDRLDPDATRVFQALEGRLRVAPLILVAPGELAPHLGNFTSSERVGRLLKSLGFDRNKKRRRDSVVYQITREQFTEQARRYGYPTDLSGESAAEAERV
jgi:hypothetical protein